MFEICIILLSGSVRTPLFKFHWFWLYFIPLQLITIFPVQLMVLDSGCTSTLQSNCLFSSAISHHHFLFTVIICQVTSVFSLLLLLLFFIIPLNNFISLVHAAIHVNVKVICVSYPCSDDTSQIWLPVSDIEIILSSYHDNIVLEIHFSQSGHIQRLQ